MPLGHDPLAGIDRHPARIEKHALAVLHQPPATPEEFESHALKVEKVVPGKSKGIVRIGPLKAGKYPFVGEYHESTAKGVITAE